MRIDAMNKVSQLYQTNTARKSDSVSSKRSSDKLEISQIGKDYQVAKQAVSATPDVREEKIAQLQSAMANGTYNVSDDELAEKLLDYFEI